MKLIDALTDDAKQSLSVVLDDGSKVDLTFEYKESQQGWFYSMVYGTTLTVYNRRLVNSPNMIRQFRNILPFGLSCIVTDGLEPVYIDDFTTGRVLLYVLNPTDVAIVEDTIIPSYLNVPAKTPAWFLIDLPNGGFETWSLGTSAAPDFFEVTGGITVSKETTEKTAGTASMKLSTTGGAGDQYAYNSNEMDQTLIENTKSKTIKVTCKVKTSSASQVAIGMQDDGGPQLSPFHTGGGGWETLTVTGTFTATHTFSRPFIIVILDAGAVTAYFDEATVVEVI